MVQDEHPARPGCALAAGALIDQDGPTLKEAITEKIYNANFMNGHLYGVPAAYYYGGTWGIMLREDLRVKYGAELPTSEEGWASQNPSCRPSWTMSRT